MKHGHFFTKLTETRNDSQELVTAMEKTVHRLLQKETDTKNPGMLLGKIQSGKTRAFIGIMALGFDNGYDVTVILTKGTKALVRQTIQRLENDFDEFIENDQIKVMDIMAFPDNLTPYELRQKLAIVAKKEVNNMRKVIENLVRTYPDLAQKRVLIIDDEADYASVSFRQAKVGIEIGKITSQIDELRRLVADADYLQVTATPYSLYLQPSIEVNENTVYFPKKPAFTELVPIHPGYIGGDFYFVESRNEESTAHYVYEEVSAEERDSLKKEDRRRFKIEDALESPQVRALRKAIMNFIVGGCIRRLQQEARSKSAQKYSFVAHSEISRQSHEWQRRIVETICSKLTELAQQDSSKLKPLVDKSYEDLKGSVELIDSMMPTCDAVRTQVYGALRDGHIMVTVVNSEKDAEELLDRKGQLHLRTPLNIFIGGQILDRGITIQNLIGFYYGRKPQKFQQDTVLQHSRMYGARDAFDLAVTRFYTTRDIYDVMSTIHEFDTALREGFRRGEGKNGVYFIRRDVTGRLSPCSPNKLLLSSLTALRPNKRMLPVGFQTDFKVRAEKCLETIDSILGLSYQKDLTKPFLVDKADAMKIIDQIEKSLLFKTEGYSWDAKAFKASIEHLSGLVDNPEHHDKVWILVRTDRNLSRFKVDGSFSDAPDTQKTEGQIAKQTAIDLPILMLFRQNGERKDGWQGVPFWWPVLVTPKNTKVTVFASETMS